MGNKYLSLDILLNTVADNINIEDLESYCDSVIISDKSNNTFSANNEFYKFASAFFPDKEYDDKLYFEEISKLFFSTKENVQFIDFHEARYLCCVKTLLHESCGELTVVTVTNYSDLVSSIRRSNHSSLIDRIVEQLTTSVENSIVFDNIFDLFTVADGSGRILRTNAAVSYQFGIPEDEIIGTTVQELEYNGVLSHSITKEVLKSKSPSSLIQDTQTGKRLLVNSTPILDANGNISKVVNISRDITELDKLQTTLSETENLLDEYEERLGLIDKSLSNPNLLVSSNINMQNIFKTVEQITTVDSTVLIEGETGTGKTLLAETIHKNSARKNGPFLKIDCSTIPDNLIESELFGYSKGAFTGANEAGKKGLVAMADGGTLFLDEVAEVPLNIQVKLLNLLQDKTFTPVGSVTPISLDVRIIAATNKNVLKMVHEGTFREDLYYRLNVVPIKIPPLRERKSEIPILSIQFLTQFCKKYNRKKRFSQKTLNILSNAPWPGNIRELENIVERLVVTTPDTLITPDNLPQELIDAIHSYGYPDEAISIEINRVIPLKDALALTEEKLIQKAIEIFPDKTSAAKALGVHRTTVSRKTTSK